MNSLRYGLGFYRLFSGDYVTVGRGVRSLPPTCYHRVGNKDPLNGPRR